MSISAAFDQTADVYQDTESVSDRGAITVSPSLVNSAIACSIRPLRVVEYNRNPNEIEKSQRSEVSTIFKVRTPSSVTLDRTHSLLWTERYRDGSYGTQRKLRILKPSKPFARTNQNVAQAQWVVH